MKLTYRNYIFIFIFLITIFFSVIKLDQVLDGYFNTPSKKSHTEVMLWSSASFSPEPGLDLSFEITPGPETIKVNFNIKNLAEKEVKVKDLIDITLVEAIEKKAGDPGQEIWRLSRSQQYRKPAVISLRHNDVFHGQVVINRNQIGFNKSQYYVNTYFKEQFVAQYKVIEGLL